LQIRVVIVPIPVVRAVGAMAMGEASAEYIVNRSRKIKREPEYFKDQMDKARAIYDQHQKGGLDALPHEFEYKYRRLVNEFLAPPKTGAKLKRFLEETQIMEKEQEEILARDAHEFMKCSEVKAGLFSARIAAMASLFREESRFGFFHHRVDFPEKNDEVWKCRIMISKGDKGPSLRKEGIRT